MNPPSIRVAVDVGSAYHRVAIGLPDGKVLDEFDIQHNAVGFDKFFHRIEMIEMRHQLPVAVAMEGFNGWARPLDGQILRHGYRLYSVNNLKLARYKEIFPAPAKTDAIDACRILELFRAGSVCLNNFFALLSGSLPHFTLPVSPSAASRHTPHQAFFCPDWNAAFPDCTSPNTS